MSCLSILVGRIANDLNVSCKIASETTRVSLLLDHDNLNISCKITPDATSVSIVRIPSDLNITFGIVCSLADVLYLDVSPNDVQWITEDTVIMYNVSSNTSWVIK